MRPVTTMGRRRLALAAGLAAVAAMTTTPGAAAAAAAVGAGADPACMQATTATHFMAFVVPEGSAASGAALSLHAPKVTVGREEEVAVAELQEVHWRVLGAPARGFRQPLPQVDVFAPPRAELVVVLDGMLTSTDKTSYLAGLARQGHYHARIAGLSGVEDAAEVFAGETTLEAIPAATDGGEGGRAVVCVSADPKVRGLALCAEGAGGGQLVVDPLASRVEMEALVAGVREMEEEAGIEGATLGTAEEELRRFRLDRPADRKFLSELQALLRLPAQAKEAYSSNAKSKRGGHNSNKRGLFGGGGKKQQEQEQEQGESRPATDVFLYAADGLRMLEVHYGQLSPELEAASRLTDLAIAHATRRLAALYEERGEGPLVSQVVLRSPGGLYAAASLSAMRRRRMQGAAAGAEGNEPVTDEDIFNVNIIGWTTVGLIVTLLMSLCLLFGADSGPKDSLLYAKFQADTTGGKMD